MAAYMIVNLEVKDPQAFEEYRAAVPALIRKHGGEYLVRGGALEVIEGNWKPSRMVVFRFPSRDAIHAFFADPEYQPLLAIRQRAAYSEIVAADGV